MKNKFNEFFKPSVVLLSICLVVSLALAATNLLTKDKIAEMNRKAVTDALAEVMPGCEYGEEVLSDDGAYSYYFAEKDGSVCGYIFNVTEKGYGGNIAVMTAISTDGKVLAVKAVDVSGETVGLGQRTSEKEFSDQFAGLEGNIGVSKTNPKNNEIKAVTGATITSKAFTKAVNTALEGYKAITGETEAE